MANKIIFDVGANNGDTFIHQAEHDKNIKVYAFEPTPQLVKAIRKKTNLLPNYEIIETAVGDYDGRTMFNIAGNNDWGCSSLLPLSPNAATEWDGRTDMQVTETLGVLVMRLDTFMQVRNIPRIDYLHIDTQGYDLRVLLGLGEFLSTVAEGVMEAAAKPEVLYLGQNSMEESVLFLDANGFEVTHMEYNDPQGNEVNIHFKRRKSN